MLLLEKRKVSNNLSSQLQKSKEKKAKPKARGGKGNNRDENRNNKTSKRKLEKINETNETDKPLLIPAKKKKKINYQHQTRKSGYITIQPTNIKRIIKKSMKNSTPYQRTGTQN